MAKAYSDDLRRKFIEAYQQGEGSLALLAERFHVSVGWTRKVWAAFSRTGTWERPPSGSARAAQQVHGGSPRPAERVD